MQPVKAASAQRRRGFQRLQPLPSRIGRAFQPVETGTSVLEHPFPLVESAHGARKTPVSTDERGSRGDDLTFSPTCREVDRDSGRLTKGIFGREAPLSRAPVFGYRNSVLPVGSKRRERRKRFMIRPGLDRRAPSRRCASMHGKSLSVILVVGSTFGSTLQMGFPVERICPLRIHQSSERGCCSSVAANERQLPRCAVLPAENGWNRRTPFRIRYLLEDA